jgi:ribose transport system substrate-binding protein
MKKDERIEAELLAQRFLHGEISRRTLFRRAGGFSMVALASTSLGAVLAACSSDDGDGGGSTGGSTGGTGGASGSSSFTSRIEIPQTDDMVDTAQYKKDPPWTIGYSDASLSNSARVFIWQFTQWAASEYAEIDDIVRTDANDSPDKQTSDIQDLIARGVDGIIVAATSTDAINPAIEQAMSQGIPIIIQERDVTTDQYVTWVNIKTRDIGTLQAQGTIDILGGNGKVVLLEGFAGNGAAEEARKGHEETFAEAPGIEVLATEYSSWSREDGKTIMENWLQAFPQIDAVVADSGIQQQGAYEAAAAANRADEIKVWTGDELQGWVRQVDDLQLPGVMVNRALRFGAFAVDSLANILAGNPVPHIWFDPVETVPVDNLADYIAPDTPGSDEWWDWWDLPEEWLPS